MIEKTEIEVEGKTPKEAIAIALKRLNVKKNEVKVKILSEERKGLFGMEGRRMAKVKVTMRKKAE